MKAFDYKVGMIKEEYEIIEIKSYLNVPTGKLKTIANLLTKCSNCNKEKWCSINAFNSKHRCSCFSRKHQLGDIIQDKTIVDWGYHGGMFVYHLECNVCKRIIIKSAYDIRIGLLKCIVCDKRKIHKKRIKPNKSFIKVNKIYIKKEKYIPPVKDIPKERIVRQRLKFTQNIERKFMKTKCKGCKHIGSKGKICKECDDISMYESENLSKYDSNIKP